MSPASSNDDQPPAGIPPGHVRPCRGGGAGRGRIAAQAGRVGAVIELPVMEPCTFCEGMAGRERRWAMVEEGELTLTVVNPWQFETGQCCVITRRHVATLLELDRAECQAILIAAQRVAQALVSAYHPLGLLTFQNNGVYSGQETPHFHFHVVPRQPGSEWGIGPPQLATFEGAGRRSGTAHDPAGDARRRERVQVSSERLAQVATHLRSNLPP